MNRDAVPQRSSGSSVKWMVALVLVAVATTLILRPLEKAPLPTPVHDAPQQGTDARPSPAPVTRETTPAPANTPATGYHWRVVGPDHSPILDYLVEVVHPGTSRQPTWSVHARDPRGLVTIPESEGHTDAIATIHPRPSGRLQALSLLFDKGEWPSATPAQPAEVAIKALTPSNCQISGYVVDATGLEAPWTRVDLHVVDSGSLGWRAAARADEHGRFEIPFGKEYAKAIHIAVQASDPVLGVSMAMTALKEPEQDVEMPEPLRLEAHDVRWLVTDPHDQPLAGVIMEGSYQRIWSGSCRTDANGAALIRVPPISFWNCRVDGYRSLDALIEHDASRFGNDRRVVLWPTAAITKVSVRTETDTPATSGYVEWILTSLPGNVRYRSSVDKTGSSEMLLPQGVACAILARRAQTSSVSRVHGMQTSDGSPTEPLVWEPGLKLDVSVRARSNSLPSGDIFVEVWHPDGWLLAREEAGLQYAPDLPTLPTGTWRVRAVAKGQMSQLATVVSEPGAPSKLELMLQSAPPREVLLTGFPDLGGGNHLLRATTSCGTVTARVVGGNKCFWGAAPNGPTSIQLLDSRGRVLKDWSIDLTADTSSTKLSP